jgi:hypothetical protein
MQCPRLDSEIQLCTCLERFRVPQGAMFFRPIKTRASSLLLLCSFAKATLQWPSPGQLGRRLLHLDFGGGGPLPRRRVCRREIRFRIQPPQYERLLCCTRLLRRENVHRDNDGRYDKDDRYRNPHQRCGELLVCER